MTERIKFIIRGDAGEYETDQGEDADALVVLMRQVTYAEIKLLCRTPDGEENVLETTGVEEYAAVYPCQSCAFYNLCKEQSNESANEALNRYLYDGGAP